MSSGADINISEAGSELKHFKKLAQDFAGENDALKTQVKRLTESLTEAKAATEKFRLRFEFERERYDDLIEKLINQGRR